MPAQQLKCGTTRMKAFTVVDARFDLKYYLWNKMGGIMIPLRNQIREDYIIPIRETAIQMLPE